LPLKLGCIQKFHTSFFKREKRKIDNYYTEEVTKAAADQGLKKQHQTQVRPQRREDSLSLPGPCLRGSNLFQVSLVCVCTVLMAGYIFDGHRRMLGSLDFCFQKDENEKAYYCCSSEVRKTKKE
jgi:hypothetical protein